VSGVGWQYRVYTTIGAQGASLTISLSEPLKTLWLYLFLEQSRFRCFINKQALKGLRAAVEEFAEFPLRMQEALVRVAWLDEYDCTLRRFYQCACAMLTAFSMNFAFIELCVYACLPRGETPK